MPTSNSKVVYKYGAQSAYDALAIKDDNTIYFITDTHKIYVGSTEYSGGSSDITLDEGVYGNNVNTSPAFGGTIKVPSIEVNEDGVISDISEISIGLPTGGNFSSAVTVITPTADMNPATKKYVDDALDNFSSPVTYYATYGTAIINELEVENVFTLYEVNDGTEAIISQFVIAGGGGGGGSVTDLTLTNNNGMAAFAVAKDANALVKFTFTSTKNDTPTGNGVCKIVVNGKTRSTTNISQGYREIDVKSYLSIGDNSVSVTCTDIYGNYETLAYTITVIELRISSTFDDTAIYDDDITFKYTPYGLIEKTIHIKVDNTEILSSTTTAHNQQSTTVIPAMTHGVHRLDVYITAVLDGVNMESNHLLYDVMCTEDNEDAAFIASPFSGSTASQGELISIPYTVFDPTAISCDIELNVYTVSGGTRTTYSTQAITVDRTRQIWNTRQYPTGVVYFEISYPDGSISKTHTITVSASSIDVQPVSNDLEVALLSAGRSNNEANPAIWTSNGVTTTFTNVNWSSSGWLEDSDSNVALRLGGGSQATVQFQPFNKDLRTNGKTIELEFRVHDVNNRDAIVIDCMSGNIGIRATADTAVLKSEQSSVECRYKDNEKVRVSFVIESRSEYRMMSVYLNGVLSGAKQYPANDNFQQSTPVNITIGSQYCTVDVYAIRIYDTALSTKNITNNYIADITDIAQKVSVYEGNNIYDEYGNLSYNLIKPKIPVMTIIGTLPTYKGDKKSVTITYEDPVNTDLNFSDTCTIDVQGTSSQWYVRKNWKLKFPNRHRNAPDMMPAKVFCMKVDYAEGTGTHNTQNANLVDTLYVDKVPAQNDDSHVRTAVYGVPCVIFHKADSQSEPVFYGKANFNYDKGAENVFGFTSNYDVECWEFKNNTSDVCNFNAEMPVNWDDDFEARYPEDNDDISRLSALVSWVYSTKNDLTKFKNEFENHFNKNYTLTYYVYTFVMLMVDQRAKNMMFTYWNSTGKWYPYFYD